MKWLGAKVLPLAELRLPGDMKMRMATERIRDMAGSIENTGGRAIHHPVIHAKTKVVICGRDRLAAHMLRGDREVLVEIVECTPTEAEYLEVAENARRRGDNVDSLRADYVAVLAKLRQETATLHHVINRHVGEELPSAPSAKKRGRPKDDSKHQAARDLGISMRTLNRAEKLARDREEGVTPADAPPPPKAPTIATFGLADVDVVATVAEAHQELIDEADSALRRAQAALTKLKGAGFNAGVYQRIQEAVHGAAYAVRQARPASVCPWCKLVPELQKRCRACGGVGYAVESQLADLPPELKAEGAAAQVAVDGKFRKRSTFKPAPEQAAFDEDSF